MSSSFTSASRAGLAVVMVLVAFAANPAHAQDAYYSIGNGQGAGGGLGSGTKTASVFAFSDSEHFGDLPSDPAPGSGTFRFGCVTFHSGATTKAGCGNLTLTIDQTFSTATVTGTVSQSGGGTLTVSLTVKADNTPPAVGVDQFWVDPNHPGVPPLPDAPYLCSPPDDSCVFTGAVVSRPATTSGSIKSSTLGTVTTAGRGFIDLEIFGGIDVYN